MRQGSLGQGLNGAMIDTRQKATRMAKISFFVVAAALVLVLVVFFVWLFIDTENNFLRDADIVVSKRVDSPDGGIYVEYYLDTGALGYSKTFKAVLIDEKMNLRGCQIPKSYEFLQWLNGNVAEFKVKGEMGEASNDVCGVKIHYQ